MNASYSLRSLLASAALLLAMLLGISALDDGCGENARGPCSESAELLSESGGTVTIAARGEAFEYDIIFSSDYVSYDAAMASEVVSLIAQKYDLIARSKPDIAAHGEDAKEILIGATDRAVSQELAAKIGAAASSDSDLVWGVMYKDGKLAYTANSAQAFEYGKNDLLSLIADDAFTVPSDLLLIKVKTAAEYDAELEADKEAMYRKKLEELIARNSAFTQEQFGGEPRSMGKSPYRPPVHYPAAGVHPRVYVTEDRLDDILEIIEDPTYASLVKRFWDEVALEGCTDGFPVVEFNDPNDEYEKDYYRYDVNIISALQNKAFAYLLTGNEVYGYEAIIGTKSMILTLEYSTYIHRDMYHGPSHLMIAIAKIYDWCYDLMSEDDKSQIIAGVSNILAPGMEMKFPPNNLNAVSGHGTGPQLLRDYMMICISFYDEMPDWWEYVGGRFYEEYVPAANEYTKNGWVTQGTATYGPGKYHELMIPAWLIYLSTGQICYDTDGISRSPYYVISHLQGNGRWFQTGDGGRNKNGASTDFSYLYTAAALFKDPVLTAYLYEVTNDLNNAVKPDWGNDDTAAKLLTYLAYLPEPVDDPFEYIDTIQYFEDPAGQMTARSSWDDGAAVVFMKIGTMTMANHDIYDHGTFQIYYKGLLAGTSGTYNEYGSNVHKYYLQSTVAHNGILVFNPAFAEATPILGTDENGNPDPYKVTNGQTYFYSGSQKRRSEAGTLSNWLAGNYVMGEITGYDMGYSYTTGKAEYAYIAGDIARSYDSATVKYLERRMLTVFTDDPNYPMLFFTFDTIESTNASFTKTYLLHTTKEPTVDEANMTADIREGEGRLLVHSLFGAEKIEKIGGEGYAYWINGYYDENGNYVNGKNCVDQYAKNDNANQIWGRMQLTASGETTSQLLTAMYVTDATNEATPLFGKFSNEHVYGASFDRIFTVFSSSRERRYSEFFFETEGEGLYKYYLSGVDAGTWKVSVDGVTVANVYVEETDAFASFIAPAGNVKLTPGDDVIGANGGRIQYNTNGGILGDGASYSYNSDSSTPLTTDVTRGMDTFLGWYTTETFEKGTEITEIPAGALGTFAIYARWLSIYVDEDYSETAITGSKEINTAVNGINYIANNKDGASFTTKTDGSGVNYLEWIEGTMDPIISVTNTTNNFSTMSSPDETVSFEFTIAKDGDKPIMPLHLRIQSNVEYGTGANRVFGEHRVFTLSTDGTVRLGNGGAVIGNISDGSVLGIRIAVNFKDQTLTAYDEDGFEIQSMEFTVPTKSGAPNGSEWRKLMQNYLAYVYASGAADHGGSLRIYGIRISESNVLENTEGMASRIFYETNGGTVASDAPKHYSNTSDTPLPEITKANAVFDGWYLTEGFEDGTRVEKIAAGTDGPVTVYAKWLETFVDTDFSGKAINATVSANSSADGVDFLTNGKEGASATTKKDGSGRYYVEWVKGSSDTIMRVINTHDNFSTMASSVASFSFSFAKKPDVPILASSQIILQSNVAADGTEKVFGSVNLFSIGKDGSVTAPNGTEIALITESAVSDIRFTIDFENGSVTYYNEDCSVITVHEFSAPAKSGAASTAEWQRLIKQYLLYFRANNNSIDPSSTLLVYGITIAEGNIFD